MHKSVFLLAVLLSVVAAGPMKPTSLELVSIIQLEEPCVRQGGICMRVEDCAVTNLVHVRGVMCPQQRHLGVECCYQT